MHGDSGNSAPGSGNRIDTGLWALARVARAHDVLLDPAAIAHDLALGGKASTAADLLRAAQNGGLKAKVVKGAYAATLQSTPRPLVLRLKDKRYVVLCRLKGGQDGVIYARSEIPRPISREELAALWGGELILVTRGAVARRADEAFNFRWFLSAVGRYRRPLAHVLIASLFVQLFALFTPLLFQVVIDKVLVHQSTSTLDVVVVGMILLGFFEAVLQYLRTYALSHTSNKLDVELGGQLFRRLMQLPLNYFESRPTGQTVARIRELENIRSFLTGQGLTSLIDLVFTTLFFAVLFLYSASLALVMLAIVPLYAFVAIVVRPLLRARIKERFDRSAYSQQFLVESIVGANTLKAAAAEPFAIKQWEDKLTGYVRSAFQAQTLGSIGQNSITFLSRLSTAILLLFGAREVISGHMTVGALVAFNMIYNQMLSPILRLSNLWQDFQQVQISVDRLGDIINAEPESHHDRMTELPPIKGHIAFNKVSFRYKPGAPMTLRDVSIEIAPGEVVGIIGPSGSGKSTFAKLIQRFYAPESGQVLVDGNDLNQVHPAWLRRQIGVVIQENFLFNRTIHDNIALSAPSMSRKDVVRVATLAGAHEFISRLPQGYDTFLEERGANLSGGQRQRVAIARALARNPRILILDEATSALDYESESIIQQNMAQIAQGRTVIIIAHRLAAVRECDRIIGIENGQITEVGTHDELLRKTSGLYARLWRLQSDGHAAARISA